jgi:hypothetical protein
MTLMNTPPIVPTSSLEPPVSKRGGRLVLAAGICLLGSMLPAVGGSGDFSKSLVEDPPAQEDEWEFSLTLNGWGPWADVTTAGGTKIDLGLDTIVDNLAGLIEAGVGVRKGKWSLFTDIIYVDLNFNNLPSPIKKLEIKEWLVTPKIGYRAFEGDWGYVDLQVGARYTWVDIELEGDGSGGLDFDESGSADIWDGLLGFTGHYNLNERWYLPFMLAAGKGDSDFVFEGFAGVGYHWSRCLDAYLGFKYLYYDFADDTPLTDETAYGPMLSVKYTF